jgi:hypothetical protein
MSYVVEGLKALFKGRKDKTPTVAEKGQNRGMRKKWMGKDKLNKLRHKREREGGSNTGRVNVLKRAAFTKPRTKLENKIMGNSIQTSDIVLYSR